METETAETRAAALSLLEAEGMEWARVGKGQRFVIHIHKGEEPLRALVKVASRGSAMVRTDIDDADKATISGFKDDVDHVLFAVRSPETREVSAYLVPLSEAEEAYRSTHRAWRAKRPNPDNDNTTWVLWFTDRGDPDCNGFHKTWTRYRIGGSGIPVASEGAYSRMEEAGGGLSIEEAKAGLATRFKVPTANIRISIEY